MSPTALGSSQGPVEPPSRYVDTYMRDEVAKQIIDEGLLTSD